jgi:hypothetical protein
MKWLKSLPVIFSFYLFTTTLWGQYSFQEHVLINEVIGFPVMVDIDHDNDIDFLSIGPEEPTIYLYENDGNLNFSISVFYEPEHRIDFGVIDLDMDGDYDLLSATEATAELLWFENDGNQNFLAHIICQDYEGIYAACPVDIDGDNDIDVIAGSFFHGELTWWENDSNMNFTGHDLPGCDRITGVFGNDIDEDDDIDILVETGYEHGSNPNIWLENDGNQNFTERDISAVQFSSGMWVGDIDSDNDKDIVTLNDFAWHENDGNQNFSYHIIGNPQDYYSFFVVDIDKDLDIDIITEDNELLIWENDGNENFTPHTIKEGGGYGGVIVIDLDKDNDLDIIKLSTNVLWYENQGVSNINDINNLPKEFKLFQNYPNPFNPSTTIKYSIKERTSVELIMYDILGREVEVLVNEEQDAVQYKINLNAVGLASGIYFYRLQAGSFVETKKIVLMK